MSLKIDIKEIVKSHIKNVPRDGHEEVEEKMIDDLYNYFITYINELPQSDYEHPHNMQYD